MTADVKWTDDHCHVHYRGAPADQVTAVVEAARDSGVTRLITVGCDIDDSRAAIAAPPPALSTLTTDVYVSY